MNLSDDFNNALTIDEYVPLLGNQKYLHDLHYKRADTADADFSAELPRLRILVITEPWCADSLTVLPRLIKLFENNSVEFRIALRDQNPELMNKFLTDGKKAIPIFIILDDEGNFLGRFKPGARRFQNIFESFREALSKSR
ncbi:MAG: thioredoxin family protein [Calditrichaeota bacterium]|nr:thioredoxin family protein [Calditrichota bacterium]